MFRPPEGIVLASDSRTTQIVGERHRILSDSAQKVFAVGDRFGVATAGAAFIGADTIAGVMDRFLAQLDALPVADLDGFADALREFFSSQFEAWWTGFFGESWDSEVRGPAITFLVSGYDDQGVGHIREIRIPGPLDGEYSSDAISGGAVWRGQTEVIGRLIKGVDWRGLAMSGPPDRGETPRAP